MSITPLLVAALVPSPLKSSAACSSSGNKLTARCISLIGSPKKSMLSAKKTKALPAGEHSS